METLVVIGIGNEFRGDDAIGLCAARELCTLHVPWVRVLESGGDGGRLMSLWKGASAALLIDAISTGSEIGTIHRFDVAAHPLPGHVACTSSHQFGLSQALEISRSLNELPSDTVLIGIEIGSVRTGSPSVLYADVRKELILILRSEISRWDPALTHLDVR